MEKIQRFNFLANNNYIKECVDLAFYDMTLIDAYTNFKMCHNQNHYIYASILMYECEFSFDKEPFLIVIFDYIRNNIDNFRKESFKQIALIKMDEAMVYAKKNNNIHLIKSIKELEKVF